MERQGLPRFSLPCGLSGKRGAAFWYLHLMECSEVWPVLTSRTWDGLYSAFSSSLLLQPARVSFSIFPVAHFSQVALTVMANSSILGKACSQPNEYEDKVCVLLYPWGKGRRSKPALLIDTTLYHTFQKLKNGLKAEQNTMAWCLLPWTIVMRPWETFMSLSLLFLPNSVGPLVSNMYLTSFEMYRFFLSNLNTCK